MPGLLPDEVDAVPPRVVTAYGLTGERQNLPGGDETSILVAGFVLKHVLDPAQSAWSQARLARTRPQGIRIPAPRAAADGRWVVDGWTATEFVPGLRSGLGRWVEIAGAGRRLADALAHDRTPPSAVTARIDRWAVADRFAWGEVELDLDDEAGELVERLRRRGGPSSTAPQLVHGDLAGNVFFDAEDTPTVIDFSPFFRPVGYATAIVAADALLWHGADVGEADSLRPSPGDLARALVFRLVAEQLAQRPRHGARLDDHRRVLDLLGW